MDSIIFLYNIHTDAVRTYQATNSLVLMCKTLALRYQEDSHDIDIVLLMLHACTASKAFRLRCFFFLYEAKLVYHASTEVLEVYFR